ncbi:MAG TPA: S41 family peptidase [Nitrosospira sp.]|nr:S41 family peptidase [Nitrosospira sp.]
MNFGRGTVILILAAAFLGGYLMRTTLPWVASENTREAAPAPQVNDPAIRQYTEALVQIKQRAIFSTPIGDLQDMVASSLKAYLAQKDPYSDFLTSEEYARFKAAGKQRHSGIGLDVEKRRNGDIICYPLPEGPAAKAGIKPGERLLALDGVSVRGKSLPTIVALAAGQAGTEVVVELAGFSGVSRRVTVTRSTVTAPAVSDYTFRSARIIKLSNFTPGIRQELDYLVSNWHKSKPIIIDLRGCGGGDFYAAVDSAMLFLKEGEPIVSVRERSATRPYSSTTARQPPAQRVFLWQDEFTASAAEIFVAALTENVRGISIGRTSAGKGTRQDIIELQEGAALVMTTGYLVTPHGVQFDGEGLAPMYPLKGGERDTEAFFNRTAALIN